jgi:DNA-binding beta-propeller fold protein YncE
MYIASAHSSSHPQIQKYDLDSGGALALRWGTAGTGPGQLGNELHGIDTDAAGNVYVADAQRLMVHVYTSQGVWLRDFGGPGTGLGQFSGDLRGLAIDKVNGWVYVVDAEGGQIEKFDLAGNPLAHWGSVGSGPGQYADGGRQAAVDGSGHLWVADYGNFRFFEYDSNGTLLNTYPGPAQPPAPGHLSEVRDVAVDPTTGNVWTADSWDNRFQEFAPDGRLLGYWGQRNSHPPYGMDYPRGIGVDPATGNVWVSDTRESLIRVYDKAGNYLFDVGTGLYSSAPGSFRFPLDIEFFAGKAYVSDWGQLSAGSGNAQCRLKMLDASSGTELSSITVCNNGLAVDPATGNIYTVSSITNTVTIFDPQGVQIGHFGSPGTGNGQFRSAWDADISGGILYVTDARLQSVQAFTLGGAFLGKWGSRGQRATQFVGPSGISHDSAGRLYIADAGNGRVSVFDPGAVGAPDSSKPALTISSPTSGQVLAAVSPALITGTVNDVNQIGTVEVALSNRGTGLWWNARIATWQPTLCWNLASIVSSAPTSGTFEFAMVGVTRGANYQATARAIDPWGNSSKVRPTVAFSISA